MQSQSLQWHALGLLPSGGRSSHRFVLHQYCAATRIAKYFWINTDSSVSVVGKKVYIYGGEQVPREAFDPHFQVR